MTLAWCALCGIEHPTDARCPAGLEAGGDETIAWRVTVETPRGMQGYAVLVAAVGERWRARILTFPNVMWTVPGGGSSIKFFARTPQEAERQAIAFIRAHCAGRSYVVRDELEPLLSGVVPEVRLRSEDSPLVDPRFHRSLPVQFGVSRPTVVAKTVNISAGGLFVATARPLVEGMLAGLLLELEHCKVPLRGAVIWKRELPTLGRDPGMGLSLLSPPTIYVRYVQALGS